MSTLQEIFSSSGLSGVSKELIQVALPSIRLTAHSVEEISLRLGSTKFGGSPDLPKGIEWPERNSVLLPFVAQINVFEIASYDKDHLFPDAGILFFFFDQKAFFESRTSDQATAWYVYYTASPLANLQRLPIPRESIEARKISRKWSYLLHRNNVARL